MRTRIKICGITSVKAVQTAVNTGVDALGFNMYEPSSRFLTPDRTEELLNEVPPFITTVGLFVDHSGSQIESVIDRCNFDLLQFHGDEQNDFCRSFDKPFIKAVRVDKETDIERLPTLFPDSIGLLLDTWVDGQLGGTGISFDWTQVPELEKPVILAGGLCADNVQQAIRIVKPYGVDVSSGVESSPGIKDGHLIEAFVRSVSRADLGKQE